MSAYYEDDRATIYHGDCIEVLRSLPDNSVDSVVTDPPYALNFMGKKWDNFAGVAVGACEECGGDDAAEGLRVCIECAERLDEEILRSATMLGHQSQNWNEKATHSRGYADNNNAAFQRWCQLWAIEALRVLKPGGHLLAFGGTRTWHRLAAAIEDAGFEVRDSIAWMYGSGFPKSHDVSKAIDKARVDQPDWELVGGWLKVQRLSAGFTRKTIAPLLSGHKNLESAAANMSNWENGLSFPTWDRWLELKDLLGFGANMDAEVWRLNGRKGTPGEAWAEREVVGKGSSTLIAEGGRYAITNGEASESWKPKSYDITAPATPAAQQWQGWGTALKPAFEPIVVARKPLIGTVAENVLAHGTGALNIDGCRIGTEILPAQSRGVSRIGTFEGADGNITNERAGRWPANVILDESQAAELDKQSGVGVSSDRPRNNNDFKSVAKGAETAHTTFGHNDTGGASRFFYCAKAPKKERPNVDGVAHPTVKPLKLMEYLCRLVTPPGGVILEPFAGSGTTIEAALNEGFNVIGIEMTDEYLPLIMARIERHGEKLC